MNENYTLEECSHCKFFKPKTQEHLCLKGNCFVEFGKAPKETDRHNYCDRFEREISLDTDAGI